MKTNASVRKGLKYNKKPEEKFDIAREVVELALNNNCKVNENGKTFFTKVGEIEVKILISSPRTLPEVEQPPYEWGEELQVNQRTTKQIAEVLQELTPINITKSRQIDYVYKGEAMRIVCSKVGKSKLYY